MKKHLLLSLIFLFILAACGGESIEFEDSVNIEEQTLTIDGTTNLEDGAIINYQVTNYDEGEILDDGTTKVEDGTFSVDVDASEYPAGEFEIYTAFLPYTQPDDIKDVYGDDGANLKIGGVVEYADGSDEIKVIESYRTFEKQ